jgi:hypothetical protein
MRAVAVVFTAAAVAAASVWAHPFTAQPDDWADATTQVDID